MDHPLPVVFARKAIELVHGSDVLVQPRWLELGILLANVIPAEACVPRDPPGQQSATQRAVGQCRNAIAEAARQDVSLGVALEQIVWRLSLCSGAMPRNTSICATLKLLTPTARIFPAR